MKKAKILAVFGILLAMGITACNNGGESDVQSQETPATSEQGGGASSEEHKHKWGSWTIVEGKDPTCTEKGQEQRVCETCGEKEFRDKAALGHDFKNGTVTADTSTCTADGKQTIKCSRCDVTQEVDIKAHHRFEETDVAKKGDGYVGYKSGVCSLCQKKEVKIRALDGTFASGSSNKSGTPEGFMKLNTNGNEISWKFNLAGEKGLSGTLYQRGAMDAFSSNTTKTYAHTSSSSSTTVEKTEGNFRVTVNGTRVDKSAMIDVTFEDMTAGGEDSSALGDNYSPIALCKIGDILLEPGDNTIVYRRLGSYNLVISDLVFIGEEFTHTHHAAAEWSKDATSHWHACDAPGCPVEGGQKMDQADHTWAADWAPVTGSEATCAQAGKESRTCSVCGYVAERETAKLPHNFEAVKSFPADAEKDTAASSAVKCGTCNEFALRWSAVDFDADDSKVTEIVKDGDTPVGVKMKAADKLAPASQSAGSPDATVQGTLYVYKVEAWEAAENVTLSFKIKPYSGYGSPDIFTTQSGDWTPGYIEQADGTLVKSEYRYGLKVNGVDVQLGKDLYGTGIDKANPAWYDFNATFNVTKGVNTIEVLCLGGYPADCIYEYQLIGMPELELTHVHTLSEWKSNESKHWKECSGDDCDLAAGSHIQEADHTFGAKYDEVAATCTADGGYKEKCSVCNYVKETVVPKKAHEFGNEPVESTAKDAEAGTIATAAYNCANCDESVLRWSALDYDASSTKVDKHTAYIRLDGCQYLNKNAEDLGSHIFYKFNAKAATNVSLAFEAEANNGAPLFKSVEGDSSVGYELVGEEFVAQDVRYGLKVNGVKVAFGDSSSEKADGAKAWHQFPVTFDLQDGVNTIELYQFGGYRAKMYNFQITGLPHVTPSHTHTLSDLKTDYIHHWKECTGEGCTLEAGAHLEEVVHPWVDGTKVDKTETVSAYTPGTCECGKKRIKLDIDSDLNGKLKYGNKFGSNNDEAKYVFPMEAAGKGHLVIRIAADNSGNRGKSYASGKDSGGSTVQTLPDDGRNTVMSINGVNIVLPAKTYTELGATAESYDGSAIVDLGEVDLLTSNELLIKRVNSYAPCYWEIAIVY